MTVLAAITAAGASERMGTAKALLTIEGESFLSRMVREVREIGLDRPVVVLGADAERLRYEVERVGAEPLVNEDWEAGRFGSVRLAAKAAKDRRLLLWPVDCPGVSPETITALLAEGAAHPDRDVVPVFTGRGGHPVLLSSGSVVEVAGREGPEGNLREIVARRRRDLAVEDAAVLDNLNTHDDYEAFLARERGIRAG